MPLFDALLYVHTYIGVRMSMKVIKPGDDDYVDVDPQVERIRLTTGEVVVINDQKPTFKAYDWQVAPWNSEAKFLVLSGAAGGGKSFLAANKMHRLMQVFPNSSGLVLRKTRASLQNSTVAMLKEDVIGNDPDVIHWPSKFRFDYANGSQLLYGGLKDDQQTESIRSIGKKGGIDFAWMEEATLFTIKDFNEVKARLRGNATRSHPDIDDGFTQIILTTNPDGPLHWIRTELILPAMEGHPDIEYYASNAHMNASNPQGYIDTLRSMTGVERQRLYEGLWVQASGLIFGTWEDRWDNSENQQYGENEVNVIDDSIFIPGKGPIVWWADDGMSGKKRNGQWTGESHPRCILLVQLRDDGRIAIFHESYKASTLAEAHIEDLLEKCEEMNWPRPSHVVHDRAAASFRVALKGYGLRSRFNTMRVEESIKEVMKFISPDVDGVRRLVMHPCCTDARYEFTMFARTNDRIIKKHDHAIDCIRYGLWDFVFGDNGDVDVSTYNDFDEIHDLKQLYGKPKRLSDFGRDGIDIATY